jgi:hypothetical protein
MTIEASGVIIPSSPADRKKLKLALTEMTYALQRIDDEKSAMKDISEDTAEKFALPKKLINKLARTMYKRDYDSLTQENEDFELLYETLVEGNKLAAQALEQLELDDVRAGE